jgi:tRNA1Val (adenine37-N6)-methyltransferase
LGVSADDCTLDGFLGGRLTVAQPRRGFRAGHDTVLLAAAVPAQNGSAVLELGAGAGTASLCLAARVAQAHVTGIEIDPSLVALANENAARNVMADRVRFELGDVAMIRNPAQHWDHVFFNPPFHPAAGQESPSPGRDSAMRDVSNAIGDWMRVALAMTSRGGTVTAIIRADRVKDILAAAEEGNGTVVFPLFPRKGEIPKRSIVQLVKDRPEPLRIAAGLILHEADGRNTEAAEAVLRHRAALRLV